MTQDKIKPSLECPDTNVDYGGSYKLKIGLLSVDELLMAGYHAAYINDSAAGYKTNYLSRNQSFWTMSASSFKNNAGTFFGEHLFVGNENISLSEGSTGTFNEGGNQFFVLPVINLKSNVIVTGSGSQNDPYVVE